MTDVIADVLAERKSQDKRFGIQDHPMPTWMVILAEEVGEAAKDMWSLEFGPHKGATAGQALEMNYEWSKLNDLRAELVQVAAVAIAMIECLDRTEIEPKREPYKRVIDAAENWL